jgi:omega-6 fatty acid desaturase (delta-12 desaturase)
MPVPGIGKLRSVLPEQSRVRSTIKGTSLFLAVLVFYVAFFWIALVVHSWAAKFLLGWLIGLSFSVLFVIGHDACHDSLTPYGALNSVMARIAFLPSLHPYCTWELGHNRLHHGWTNLKGVDYVYTPFSKAEFDALPPVRRFMERVYRTVPGAGLFYLIEIWWRHLILPRPEDWPKLNKRTYAFDIVLVTLFLALEIGLAVFAGNAGSTAERIYSVFCLVIVPYLFWNWVMAFVTLQHHTHPNVAWFDTKEEWNFFNGQIRGTVHLTLPRPIELLFQNILEHTAHHVDPKIPLYNLTVSQKKLEHEFTEDITVQKGSIAQFRDSLRLCQLYDYRQHRWLKFDGTPSTDPIIPAGSQAG